MALARSRRNESGFNYWPGFVDALSTLVLSIVFLLSVFLVVQFFLSQEVTGNDKALEALNAKIAQLNDLRSLEKLTVPASVDSGASASSAWSRLLRWRAFRSPVGRCKRLQRPEGRQRVRLRRMSRFRLRPSSSRPGRRGVRSSGIGSRSRRGPTAGIATDRVRLPSS